MPLNLRKYLRYLFWLILCLSCAAGLAGCEKPQPSVQAAPVVSVVTIHPERIAIRTDLPGRVAPVREAQIRARVTGIVQKILFRQGGDIREGELLFKIDPAPYQATLNQATAQLRRAQADAHAASMLVKRYEPLVKVNAISRQDFDNAVSNAQQAQATVTAAQATMESASINLGYTNVTSPITGRIGKPFVTEGALVEASTATQMAIVQQLSPIYIDVVQSTGELARLRKLFKEGVLQRVDDGAVRASVILEDGAVYPETARLLFTGISVNEGTGQVTLRTEVNNPEEILLPGMFVRVRIDQGIDGNAILVPAQALQRASDGRSAVYVIRNDKVASAQVELGPNHEGRVLVTKGLAAGDVVIVEGFQKVRPGAPVKAVPWRLATPRQSDQKSGPATQPASR